MTIQDVTLISVPNAFNVDANNQVTYIKPSVIASGTQTTGYVPTLQSNGTLAWATGGGNINLQQVLNVGNTASNASSGVNSLSLVDTTTSKTTSISPNALSIQNFIVGASSTSTSGVQVSLAPIANNDVVRLVDLQNVQTGIRPQNPVGVNVHISTANVTGVYVNNTGVGSSTLTGSSILTVAGVTPAINDDVVLVGQTAQLQNGSYTVISNSALGFSLRRTTVVPAFGNMWVSNIPLANNYGQQWINSTIGTIVVGTTAIIYDLFGIGTTLPANPSTGVQFNNAGLFGATDRFTWNNTSNYLTLGNSSDYGLRFSPSISATDSPIISVIGGASANAGLNITPLGTGNLILGNVSNSGLQVTGGSTTDTTLQATGNATDITINVRPKNAGKAFIFGGPAISLEVSQINTYQLLIAPGSVTNSDLVIEPQGNGIIYANGPFAVNNTLRANGATGTTGQILTSRGSGSSPIWGVISGAVTGELWATYNATAVSVNTNYVFGQSMTVTRNTLSALTFSTVDGTLTANRNCVVFFSFTCIFGSTANANEANIWFSFNGVTGTRFAQKTVIGSIQSSFLLSTELTFRLLTGDVMRCMIWCNGSQNYAIASSGFGALSRLYVSEILT